jgi:hypothetical protein
MYKIVLSILICCFFHAAFSKALQKPLLDPFEQPHAPRYLSAEEAVKVPLYEWALRGVFWVDGKPLALLKTPHDRYTIVSVGQYLKNAQVKVIAFHLVSLSCLAHSHCLTQIKDSDA